MFDEFGELAFTVGEFLFDEHRVAQTLNLEFFLVDDHLDFDLEVEESVQCFVETLSTLLNLVTQLLQLSLQLLHENRDIPCVLTAKSW